MRGLDENVAQRGRVPGKLIAQPQLPLISGRLTVVAAFQCARADWGGGFDNRTFGA